MLRPVSGERVDCPDTGMAVVLAGAHLEIDKRQVFYDAAEDLGIFFGSVTDAENRARNGGLTEFDSSFQTRLTGAGAELLESQPPAVLPEAMQLMGRLAAAESQV
jgi:hypothetical protein